MKRGARGTQRFNSLQQSALTAGQIVVLCALVIGFSGVAYAQEGEQDVLPRVRSEALHDGAVRINELLMAINKRHVEIATHVLDRVQALLERIGHAAETRARKGNDVAVVREAIASAREAIDEARMAVRDQSNHEYVVSDATDATIRERLRAVRSQLAADLQIVRNKVRLAIGAVRDAARALGSVHSTDS